MYILIQYISLEHIGQFCRKTEIRTDEVTNFFQNDITINYIAFIYANFYFKYFMSINLIFTWYIKILRQTCFL